MLCVGVLVVTGCVSKRASNNLGYAVTERIFGKMMDIPFWADAFRGNKGRLPKDYAELCQFVSQQTNSKVQLEPYSRVEFAVLPTGQRQAKCYSLAGNERVMTWGKPE